MKNFELTTARTRITQKEFSTRAGISCYRLRALAKKGLLVPPFEENGKKFYAEAQIADAQKFIAPAVENSVDNEMKTLSKVQVNDKDKISHVITPRDDDELIGPPEISDKKNKLATDASNKKIAEKNSQRDNNTSGDTSQVVPVDSGKIFGKPNRLANLPEKILSLKRFFPVRITAKGKKVPCIENWENPASQMFIQDAIKKTGHVGFDISGHSQSADFFFVDCDNIFDDSGNIIYPEAKKWFNYLSTAETFCEKSISKKGCHFIFRPTKGIFPKLTGGDNCSIFFDKDNRNTKIELFYLQNRFCLVTGDLLNCQPNTPIVEGEIADEFIQQLLNNLSFDNSRLKDSDTKITSADISLDEVQKMLDVIPCDKMPYFDWWKIGAIIHYHFGKNGFELWRAWSEIDQARYTFEACQKVWSDLDKRSKLNIGEPAKIGSLIFFAKKFGYKPQKNSVETSALMTDDGEEKFTWTQDKIKSCPVNLRLPDNYLFSRNGITLVVPPKKDNDPPKKICVARNPILPTRKFREPVKGTLEYEFAILDNEKWRKVEVDGAALADTRDLSKTLARYGAQIKKCENLREFFIDVLSLNPDLSELKSYNQTGWTTNDCEEFAYPSSDGTTIIRRAGYDYESIFKPRGSRDDWKKKFVEVTEQGGAQARTIIGCACSAPLIKPLEDLPNLQLHVWGKKSIGKTPMLKFAVSIFGNTDVDKLTHTFSATPKARLERACAFSDLPLICEELESIGANDAEKLSADIYNYFFGIGGQALKKDGTKRDPKIFSGARLTSGEHDLLKSCGNGGEFKRVLSLRCASLLDEDFASDLYGFCKRNYGLFGEQWIRYTIKNRDLISKHYHQTFDAIKTRQKFIGNERDLTQLRTLIISAVAYQHFKICIGLSKLETDADAINSELHADIFDIIATLPTAAEIDDTARAIDFLQSFVAGNDKFFAREVDKPEFNNEFCSSTPTCYGKIFKNGEVAFLPHAFKKILEVDGGFKSSDKLRNEFCDKGYLRHRKGAFTYQTWFNRKPTQMIRFNAGVISNSEENTTDENCSNDLIT